MSVLVYDCGSVENTVTAILDTESGAMIIRGNGDIDNYADESSPWYSEHSDILQVTIDKGITRIGSGTFYGCENLSFVEIASTVTSIGADVFQNCTSLTSIKIPKRITDIGNGTFTDSGLTEVKFYGNPPTVGTDIFDGVTADVYTPEGNEEWTETAKGTVAGNGSILTWKTFDSKPNLIEYDELNYLWSKIKKYVDNNVSVTPVLTSGTKIATITVNGVDTDLYSSPFSGTVGNKLKPVYINNGVPTECDDLKYPDGEILNLNAKGLTTSSIAEVNGVIDSSGYGNHGQAYGGVTVVEDAEMGDCFHFDNNATSRVVISSIGDTTSNNGYTVSLTIRHGKDTGSSWFICRRNENDNDILDWQLVFYEGSFWWGIWSAEGTSISPVDSRLPYPAPVIGEKHTYGISVDHDNKTAQSYYDGQPYGNLIELTDYPNMNNTQVVVGGPWSSNQSNLACLCDIGDVRIYPRALTTTEVKTLYILGLKSTYAGVAYHAATATTATAATTASACSGNSATATTASKLSNTSAIGNTATPVYFTSGGVPSACTRNFLSAGATKITTAGWHRVLNLPTCITGIVTISKGYNNGEPRFISFFVDNNFSSSKPNARVIATTNSGGNYLTKVRIVWKFNTTSYFEIYVTPTTEIWMMMFIPLSGHYTASAVNFTAGEIPDTYTAYEFDVPNTAGLAPVAGVRSTGSASKPVYVDANGVVQACTSVDLNATSATTATSATSATTATNANNLKVTHTGAAWRDILSVATGFTSASNQAVYGHNSGAMAYYVDANATSGNQRAILRLGNATANTTADGHNGLIWMYGTSTGYTEIKPGYNSTSNITLTLPSATGIIALTSSNITGSSASCTGNAATATKIKSTTEANANWYSVLGVLNTATSGTNNDTYRAVGNNISFRNDANAATAYSRMLLGNATASTSSASAARAGLLCLYGTNTGYANLIGPNITSGINVYMPSIGGYIPVSSDNTVRNIQKVSSLPSSPNANTLYIVTG